MPRRATHIPLYYNVTSSGRPVDCYYGENPGNCYVDSMPTPCYPFGFGLSYTEFEYTNPSCDVDKISLSDLKSGGCVTVSVSVKNVGSVSAKETVQLYIRDVCASIMRPIRELKGFKKVEIASGKTVKVSFNIGYDDLGFYDESGNYVVETGKIELFIGKDCLTENKTEIEII